MELNENEVVAKFATTNLCLCIKSQLVQKMHRFRRAIICANFAYTKDSGCREGFTQTNEITLYNLNTMVKVVVNLINKSNYA